ncbi:hypothetical protein [Streptomyces sp. NBC_01264]|uniref:hypothetical protein n=1 Tax=Streptomyces sp. NBC_01264 TaxID=2903804 RepID=UPI00224E6695|nr:hypothetical protein [Streptomyces sp. NBC_01264]MCX4780072.1 hypothetical protein [Streptomyces sp. NBC_01264]
MRLHWIITLQWPADDGLHTKTMDGTIEPNAGATRQAIYSDAYEFAAQHMGAKDAAVLSFILEPDEL